MGDSPGPRVVRPLEVVVLIKTSVELLPWYSCLNITIIISAAVTQMGFRLRASLQFIT
jgi:hypothetical protein